MSRAGRRLGPLVALALALVGCQTMLWSWPPGEPVPDVVGVWEGVWDIVPPLPTRLIITDQRGATVSGMVTYELAAAPASSRSVTGQFGVRRGRRVLLLEAGGLDRTDVFELTTLEPDRLDGAGAGQGFGAQRGAVTLHRR